MTYLELINKIKNAPLGNATNSYLEDIKICFKDYKQKFNQLSLSIVKIINKEIDNVATEKDSEHYTVYQLHYYSTLTYAVTRFLGKLSPHIKTSIIKTILDTPFNIVELQEIKSLLKIYRIHNKSLTTQQIKVINDLLSDIDTVEFYIFNMCNNIALLLKSIKKIDTV